MDNTGRLPTSSNSFVLRNACCPGQLQLLAQPARQRGGESRRQSRTTTPPRRSRKPSRSQDRHQRATLHPLPGPKHWLARLRLRSSYTGSLHAEPSSPPKHRDTFAAPKAPHYASKTHRPPEKAQTKSSAAANVKKTKREPRTSAGPPTTEPTEGGQPVLPEASSNTTQRVDEEFLHQLMTAERADVQSQLDVIMEGIGARPSNQLQSRAPVLDC